jgi:GNAT superfamily N-acetyltransferase
MEDIGKVELRALKSSDYQGLKDSMIAAYPNWPGAFWGEQHIETLLRIFPKGQIAIFVDDELVSIVSLFLKDGKAQFRKFATEVPHQGKGYGTFLLNYLLKETEGLHVSSVWCNARTEKAGYYERFGLLKTNATYMKGGIEFVVMEKVLV